MEAKNHTFPLKQTSLMESNDPDLIQDNFFS